MAWLCSRVLILETAFRFELIWWVECEQVFRIWNSCIWKKLDPYDDTSMAERCEMGSDGIYSFSFGRMEWFYSSD